MSSEIDPAKLKVVELRAELSKRGLDSKGNKPALVKRLKEALEEELKQELPDTSIADTSTEDLDSSQSQEKDTSEEKKKPEVKEPPEATSEDDKMEDEAEVPPDSQPDTLKEEDEKMEEESQDDVEQSDSKDEEKETSEVSENKPETGAVAAEENKENGEQEEPKSKKSRWANDDPVAEDKQNNVETEDTGKPAEEAKSDDVEPKGEKRRRSSTSPDRSQRRRSKSPIKEDEPAIDNNKVQLSWYDSDLHLQLDKESFLSAKPYHDGAFGFAWAGVRATHGVNEGKVCFEVKITEELKLEDFSKYHDKHRHRDKNHEEKKPAANETKGEPVEEAVAATDIKNEENGEGSENAADAKPGEKEVVEAEPTEEAKKEEPKPTEEAKKEEPKPTEEAKKEEPKPSEEAKKEEPKPTEEAKKEEPKPTEEAKKEEPKPTEDVKKPEEPKQEPMETEEETKPEKEPEEQLPTHLFRVGWSLLETELQLGEDKFSYGYESTGRFVSDKQFKEYGITFGVGDVIASFVNIGENDISISYTVNGEVQPEAIKILKSEIPENFAFFPHVLSRNYAFELNLGGKEESWFAKPESFGDYEYLDKIENKIAGPARPENRSDCEVILMCGLPASGKTHWVREYVKSNPDKKYTLLGNTHLLEKMTVSGDALKSKFKGSWTILLDRLQKCLNKLIEIAALRRRNYIIDQTNVFPSAQRRKLRPFEGFKRRAVVVVVGDEEQAKRQSLQEAQDGKDASDNTVLELKANMSLPQKGDWLDEVIYAGVNEEEAKTLIQKYNTQGREAGFGIQRRFGHRDDRHRWQNRRNDYRGGNYRDRNYHSRYDRGPPRQGNWHPQRPGGWNRDRRDNRGPPAGGSREWRNRGNGRDRGSRDSHGQGNNYNRNRNQPGRGPGGNWQSGNWNQGQGSWGGSNQAWGGGQGWGQGNWNQSSQNQWKYGGGGGQNYGNYGNWSYYGQYPQNWGSQGQTSNPAAVSTNQYGQYSQQEWAQYAQQYAQQGQNTSGSALTQSTPQK